METFKERVKRVLNIDLDVVSVDEKGEFVAMYEEIKYKVNIHKEEIEILPELTWGQRLVGFNFNPSRLSEVDVAKQRYADIIDQARNLKISTQSEMQKYIADSAIDLALSAQMMLVKALTWKD